MCEQEVHQSLTQPAHCMRHIMEVEQAHNTAVYHDIGKIGLEKAICDATEALKLASNDVTDECKHMLELARNGYLTGSPDSA